MLGYTFLGSTIDVAVFVSGMLAALCALEVNHQYALCTLAGKETQTQLLSLGEMIKSSNFHAFDDKGGPEVYKGLIRDVQLAPGSYGRSLSSLVGACAVSGYAGFI